MTQEELIKDFDYDWVSENIIGEFNRIIDNTIEGDFEFYEDKKETFYTYEEKEEIKEAIKQKVALMVTDKLKDFILLRK